MTKSFVKLAHELAEIKNPTMRRIDGEYVDVLVSPLVFQDKDNAALLILSAEDGAGFADYYGEFRGSYPYIDPRLEAWAKKNGMMWEWRDPGSVGLYVA